MQIARFTSDARSIACELESPAVRFGSSEVKIDFPFFSTVAHRAQIYNLTDTGSGRFVSRHSALPLMRSQTHLDILPKQR